MNLIKRFDVVIVYSSEVATSATLRTQNPTPFNNLFNENCPYVYFLQSFKDKGVNAGLSTSLDILGAGKLNSYWTYNKNKWQPHLNPCVADKFFFKYLPYNNKRLQKINNLLSLPETSSFNDLELVSIFIDKYRTYQKFPKYSIPTVDIKSSHIKDIKNAINKLYYLKKISKTPKDFSKDIILKDRFGLSGNKIYKITQKPDKKIFETMSKHKETSFVIQPFLRFDKGFVYKNKPIPADIRLIFLGKKLVQTYIRVAPKDNFLCNESQGGQFIYIEKSQIPQSVIIMSKLITTKLNSSGLYTLDFICSNNGNAYFLEGNTQPGLFWNDNKKEAEMAKELIDLIVQKCATNLS